MASALNIGGSHIIAVLPLSSIQQEMKGRKLGKSTGTLEWAEHPTLIKEALLF